MNQGLSKGLLLLILTFLSIFTVTYADPPLPTPIGRVVWVKGTLTAIMANKEERSLQKMSVIYLHDILVTDTKSQAQIVFTDESLMTFYPNTRYSTDKYAFSQSKKGSLGSYVGNLIEGGFRTITGLIAKNHPNDYQVNTPVATIGVRGTDFAIYYKNGALYMARYTGTPCMRSKKNPELCLNASSPYGYVPGLGAAPVVLSQQPDVFNEKLEVIPFQIQPFPTLGGGGGGGGGVITSFCITQ